MSRAAELRAELREEAARLEAESVQIIRGVLLGHAAIWDPETCHVRCYKGDWETTGGIGDRNAAYASIAAHQAEKLVEAGIG